MIVCGPAPADGTNAWRPTVEVHAKCEVDRKKKFDEFYAAYEALSSSDPSQWSLHQANIIRKRLGGLRTIGNGEIVGTVGGGDILIDAAWTWVRGLHSILYNS